MKTIRTIAGFLLLATGIAGPLQAEVISGSGTSLDGTEVGDPDPFIDAILGMSSGEQTEVNWVNSMLGTSFETSDMSKAEDVTWYTTASDNIIAFMLQTGPGYYILKNARWHLLFENVTDVNWGVVDLSYLLYTLEIDPNLGNDMMISHVSEFGGEAKEVPEPSTLALLGAGLLLLGISMSRPRRNALAA